VSFPSEVVRTTYHTVKLALTELQNPATKQIGATRLAGLALSATLSAGLAAGSRAIFGVDRDEEDSMRRFLPAWSKDHQLLHLGNDNQGNRRYLDLGHTDPHSYLMEPVIAALRAKTPEDGAVNAAKSVAKPFAGEELLTGKLLDLSRNEKAEGGEVYNPQATTADKAATGAGHVGEAFTPGTYTAGRRLVKSVTGEPEQKTGRLRRCWRRRLVSGCRLWMWPGPWSSRGVRSARPRLTP
jgi:hypothetical protein